MTVPVALPRTRIIRHVVIIRPGGVGRLAAAGAPVRNQIRIGRIVIHVVPIEVGGCTGIVYPHVGILHIIQRTILLIIFCGKLTARGENYGKPYAMKSALTKFWHFE